MPEGRSGVAFGRAAEDEEDPKAGFVRELRDEEEEEQEEEQDDGSMEVDEVTDLSAVRGASHPAFAAAEEDSAERADAEQLAELKRTDGSGLVNTKVADRETAYQKRRYDRGVDVGAEGQSYQERMQSKAVAEEREQLLKELEEAPTATKAGAAQPEAAQSEPGAAQSKPGAAQSEPKRKRRKRWDDAADSGLSAADSGLSATEADASEASEAEGGAGKSSSSGQTVAGSVLGGSGVARRRRWDQAETESEGGKWNAAGDASSVSDAASMASSASSMTNAERDIARRNRPWSDAELDALLPSEGFAVLAAPQGYEEERDKQRSSLLDAPDALGDDGFSMGGDGASVTTMGFGDGGGGGGGAGGDGDYEGGEFVTGDGVALPALKGDDAKFFSALLENAGTGKDGKDGKRVLTAEQQADRKVSILLLKIKNGDAVQRKAALRQITLKARDLGASALFKQILPLLMSPTLEDQERHLLVKVIDRVLYRLDDLVRPYAHNILVVIEPMLIDDDFYARAEGRELIANLAKAAGLNTMLATMRPDIDHADDFVRNATARALAVVGCALGIPSMLPFLRAVSKSKKTWQARHTGIKVVQQMALQVGCAVLPHLTGLVGVVQHGLTDADQKVRTMTALALAALAEAAHPYGIESFDAALEPLWKGVRQHHGKTLAAFLKAIGCIIPLMDDEEYASYFTQEVMVILIREFKTPDEHMRRIVLKVVLQCVNSDGVTAKYVRDKVAPDFFRSFWVRRMALDRRNAQQLVETTVGLADKMGGGDVVARVVDDLKDENEPYRRMVMQAVGAIVDNHGVSDISLEVEARLVDGALFAFQEQGAAAAALADPAALERETSVVLNGFATLLVALGERAAPYLTEIAATIKFRMNSKDAVVRAQAADLTSRVAGVLKTCNEDQLLAHLGVIFFENLGEEFPNVLGSILGALTGIVNVVSMPKMQPPIKDLLPRLTPILKNRNEKVQENAIALIGRVADRGAEFVSARELMRVCFELIELLRAKKKAIRRATVNTFGYIAQAIGPQDVTHVLLNNLKVMDRSSRVCTTVGLAIVAENCGPFAVLPSLLNDYRITDINVQHGVLKSLSFLFEYIGDASKDYIYAVTPLLEDALCQRDAVHRQTACTAVKHLALGVQGKGCEDALLHLLNFVWPNIFETSPHVIGAVLGAIEALRVSLGAQVIFQYLLQGLFHPSRKVREAYWVVYNNLYVYAGETLVPVYPRLQDSYRVADYNADADADADAEDADDTEADEIYADDAAADADKYKRGKRRLLKVLAQPEPMRKVLHSFEPAHMGFFI